MANGQGGTANAAPRVPSPPAPTARVLLAPLAERIRELQSDRDSDALFAAIDELREDFRAIHEQLTSTQEEVSAIADEGKVAGKMCQ